MHELELIIGLLVAITVLAEVAERIRLPYPVLLVLAGIGIGLVPGLPRIELHPDVVFLIFLPPLLYAAAWNTSWTEFKAARRPIFLLALGCVLFSTGLVAVVAHYLIPDFSWTVAFVLGAIVSPPDAVAAASATKGLGVNRRVLTILEGESLVNDATGLIAYRYAVAAVLTGQFVFWEASLQLVWVAAGGAALGIGLAWVVYRVHRITPHNPIIDTSLTFLTPYLAYLVAEELHVSGVLAVVAAGLFLSRRSAAIFTYQARLQAYAVWNTIVFLLNGVVFILIGLQLPYILERLGSEIPAWEALRHGVLISLAVILGRLLWVYGGAYLPRLLSRRIRAQEPLTTWRLVTVVAWTGMRGVVSLAAALALPLLASPGVPFPHRDLILFLTFVVIFCTLVLQGLSLRPLIRWLGLPPDRSLEQEEHRVRLALATNSVEYLESHYGFGRVPEEVLSQMKTRYEIRIQRLHNRAGGVVASRLDSKHLAQYENLLEDLIRMERERVQQWRASEEVNEEVLRKLENELDLEESRLMLDRGY
ncbi:Na+/H+ antiporter [Solirubrum puertoriconensis]|uniref:Cation/H+ exchanger transmembrane domain-containing protein n=1 Tax=Solirubrum puertoriconensis TaxID=1751427 RepID=A0A9X0L5V9_SOLP1|nr:Na+/H+ antiporter [Solirubrum puertoriconensis]KUG09051.1 hypothetical protein ASU33_19705 [Solirubrum puertoriconensis]